MQKRRHLTHRTSPYQLRKMQATQYEKEQENYVQYEGDKTQEPRQVDYFEDVANYILVNPENETGEVEDPTMEQPEQEWTYAPAQIIKAPVQPYDPHDDISDKYRWRPGFCLQLGSQGRKAMLQLLRNVYKGDKRHKQILENMNPPTTISNLPFFKVSMLWELAYHLDVFEEALAIHKIYAKMKNKVYRNHHHFSRPYYDYELHKMHNTRSSRPRGIPNALYGQEYEGGKSEDQRQHAVMQKKNMDQLKRNMECLIAVKKAGPEQFIKFMSSFKQRTEACPPPPPPVMNKELDPNNQNQGEEHYDYTPQVNSQVYMGNIADCVVSPR